MYYNSPILDSSWDQESSELTEPPPTNALAGRFTHAPTPPQLIRSFSSAQLPSEMASVAPTKHTCGVVEGRGEVVNEFDQMIIITGSHSDLVIRITPTGTGT